MEKKQRVITIRVDAGNLVFDVAGQSEPLVLHMAKVAPEVATMAMMKGLGNRIIDAAALGKGATPEEKASEMRRVIDHYETGTKEWNLRVASGDKASSGKTLAAIVNGMIGAGLADDYAAAMAHVDALATKRGIKTLEAAKVFGATEEVTMAMARIAAKAAKESAGDLIGEIEGRK